MMAPPPHATRDQRAARSATAALRLADLPAEAIVRILSTPTLSPVDLAAVNATSRLFRGARGARSLVEHALRERAHARGHERALRLDLPVGVPTWTAELLSRERVLAFADAHAAIVACGNEFSAFVDAEGGLHTCGEEAVLDGHARPTGERRVHVGTGHPADVVALVPTRVASLAAVRVRAVAAGSHHLLALSDAGTVYDCGENGYGQLGQSRGRERTAAPRRALEAVGTLSDEVVLGVAACGQSSLALTLAGRAYSWGDNGFGQLGHGDEKDRWEPARIEALRGVCAASMGAMHTLLLSTSGAVFSCGRGRAGRLGHGDQQDRHTPRRIEALAGVRAVHVSAGRAHSLVVDTTGRGHAFGAGKRRCLGLGRVKYQHTPAHVEALQGVHAVRACATGDCSVVLGADGSVHALGGNDNGQLALGPRESAHTPTCVDALAGSRVLSCAISEAHALYVTADGAVHACGKRSAALGLGLSLSHSSAGETAGVLVTTPVRVERLPRLQPHQGGWSRGGGGWW